MKKSLTSLFALAAFAVLSLTARAQPAPKIFVVDIGKVFENHYEMKEKQVEFNNDKQKAKDELERMMKEGNDLVDVYKGLLDQSKNPALTPEAQAKAKDDASKKLEQIQAKQKDFDSFRENTDRQLQERAQTIRSVLVDEINKTAMAVAKRHGATLLFDKSGLSIAFGANFLIYSDPGYDITDEVIAEVNKNRPAPSDTSPAAPSNDGPKVTIPGLTPTNP